MNTLQNQSQRNALQQKYNASRANLLLMLAFTVVNIVLFFLDSATMFLFSATVPYVFTMFGYMLSAETADNLFVIIGIAVAAVIIVVYLLCWIFSKKRYGWMIAALVLFVIDTLFMAWFYIIAGEASGAMDALIHIWVLYYLITGVISGYKLKKMPEAVGLSDAETGESAGGTETADTAPLRYADMSVKSRILLEEDVDGKHICYSIVKRVNELIIGNYVYAEFEALIEPPHELTAVFEGRVYKAGTNRGSRAFISVDGEEVKSKIRWI